MRILALRQGSSRTARSFAQRTIQSFSSSQHEPRLLRAAVSGLASGSGTVGAGPHCQRACFEGTKKPIGQTHCGVQNPHLAVTATDWQSLGRRLSRRRAEPRPVSPQTSTGFLTLSGFFSKTQINTGIAERWFSPERAPGDGNRGRNPRFRGLISENGQGKKELLEF